MEFDLLLLAFLVLGTRLATLIHESLGHALFSILAGGKVSGIRISLLGGGHVVHDLPDGTGLLFRFLVACSGIALNLLTGAAVFAWLRKIQNRRLGHGFWIVFAMAGLLGGTAYAALGLYYGQGDPVAWLDGPSPWSAWFSLPFLALAPFLSYVAVKAYAVWVGEWFRIRTTLQRLAVVILTLGLSSAVYAGLYTVTGAQSRALDSPEAAKEQAVRELKREKAEALYREIRKSRPELTHTQIRDLVAQTPIRVGNEEIPKKIPLKPLLALLFGVGGLFAVFRASYTKPEEGPRELSAPLALPAAALAGAVLLVLGLTDGWLFRSF